MSKGTLPEFAGVRLDENSIANYVRDDFGQAILTEYNERVAREYDNNSALRVLSYDNDVVKGSNPFAVVLMNKIASDVGLHVATPANIETIFARNALTLIGQYVDTALVLRSRGNLDNYLANYLASQIEGWGKKVGDVPYVLQLKDLELVLDDNSPEGLAFALKDKAEIIEAPQLIGRNNGKRFSETDKTGLPSKFTADGPRTLYTRDGGLSRLSLVKRGGVSSNNYALAGSCDDRRVALVRPA